MPPGGLEVPSTHNPLRRNLAQLTPSSWKTTRVSISLSRLREASRKRNSSNDLINGAGEMDLAQGPTVTGEHR